MNLGTGARAEARAHIGAAGAHHGSVNWICREERFGAAAYPLFYARGVELAVDRVDERRLAGDEGRGHRGAAPVGVLADREGAPDALARRCYVHPRPVVSEVRDPISGGGILRYQVVRVARCGSYQDTACGGVFDHILEQLRSTRRAEGEIDDICFVVLGEVDRPGYREDVAVAFRI